MGNQTPGRGGPHVAPRAAGDPSPHGEPGAARVDAAGEATPVGRGFVPWDALDGALDAPVRPLVAALNRISWARTVYSCGGHPEEPDSVSRERRQAHVDVVVRDPARWRTFTAACRQEVQTHRESDRPSAVAVRCVEASLGPVPSWLRLHLAPVAGDPAGVDGAGQRAPAWWRRVLDRRADGAGGWQYRRLVFEPVPYDAAPAAVRAALDGALAAAVRALERVSGAGGRQVPAPRR